MPAVVRFDDDFYQYYNRFCNRDRRGIEYNYHSDHANNDDGEAVDGDNINFNDGLFNYCTHDDDGHNGIGDGYEFQDIDDEYTVSDPEEELDIQEDIDEAEDEAADGYYPDPDVIEPFGDLHYSTLLLRSNRQSSHVILKQPFKELKETKNMCRLLFYLRPLLFEYFHKW